MLVLTLKLDDATSDEDIDLLLNEPKYMALVDSSRWSATTAINVSMKSSLIQGLIVEEVIGKRRGQMENLRKGLAKFGSMLSICQRYPQKCKTLFVYSEREVLYTDFLKLMAPIHDDRHSEVLQWFRDYLKAREKEKTGAKLTVCIWSYIPRAYLVVSNNLTNFLCIGERTMRHLSYICNSILAGTGLEEKERANLGDILTEVSDWRENHTTKRLCV